MFNTQKFNLGKFNVPSTNVASASGNISATGGMTGIANIICSGAGVFSGMGAMEKASPARITPAEAEPMHGISGLTVQYYNRVAVTGEPMDGISGMTIKAAEVFGVSVIRLADIVLKPGQELIIDTENMTATIDGENAIHLLSDDSDFFFLAQGDNIVTYSDNGKSRTANLKVMWKNRWV